LSAAAAPLLPRRVLVLAGGSALVALVGVGSARWMGFRPVRSDAATVAERQLRFEDGSDGSVGVFDASSGVEIDRLHGEQGFLRGTLRGLARERRRMGVAGNPPLHLLARADGRLTLHDPATGQYLDLESFGPSNAGVYARWLPGAGGARQPNVNSHPSVRS
jgi:putative photosynthetic complex assembly protein